MFDFLMKITIHITGVTGAVGPTRGLQWMFLPLALHSMEIVLTYTLRLLHSLRLIHLISDIVHKISISITSK